MIQQEGVLLLSCPIYYKLQRTFHKQPLPECCMMSGCCCNHYTARTADMPTNSYTAFQGITTEHINYYLYIEQLEGQYLRVT